MLPVNNNPALSLHNLLPALENTRLIDFLSAYYEWLQSSKLTFVNASADFTLGEVVVGNSSRASGIVKEIGEGYLVLKIITEVGFNLRETFVGQTSGTTATVYEIEDNLLRKNSKSLDYRNPTLSTGKYLEYLKEEFNRGIPTKTFGNRRFLAKKIKDLYSSKSNEDAYEFLFNSIYGENLTIRYPGEEILRVSDGKFEKTQIIRVQPTDDIFDYLNQTIRGQSSNAVGNVVDIKRIFFGGIEIAEMTLKLVAGTFDASETVYIVDQESSNTITYGMITGINIVDAGSSYTVGDVLLITGDGSEAAAVVSSVSKAPINKIQINSVGYGYQVGTLASVINTGTGGSDFALVVSEIVNPYTVSSGNTTYTVGEISKVSILNRGKDYVKPPVITLVDTQIEALGLLSEKLITIDDAGQDYSVDDALVFTGGSGANAAGIVASIDDSAVGYDVLFEDGTNILLETQFGLDVLKDESWTNVTGPILRIELTNYGDGYTQEDLPTVVVSSITGSNATITVTGIQGVSANVAVDVANNQVGIGAIREVEITNFGIDYSNATIDATGSGDGNANLQPIISGLAISSGKFLNDDGKVGIRIIQDSLFYQDFSYVIRSGIPFTEYRELIKETLHPAGTEFFGEILISSYALLAPIIYSTIDTERNNEYVATLKSIISFFGAGINVPPVTHAMEKEIVPDNIDVTGAEHREVNVEIALPKAVAATFLSIENSPELNLFIDVGTTSPVIHVTEKEIVPDNIAVATTERREVNVEIALPKAVAATFMTIENSPELNLLIDIGSTIGDPISVEKNIEYQTDVGVTVVEPLEKNDIFFKDLKISAIANFQISYYQNQTFLDVWASQTRVATVHQKAQGTVSSFGTDIVGVGTDFTAEFSVGDYLIVDTEKFIITNIANSTFMEVNVTPAASYSGVSAYRESLPYK